MKDQSLSELQRDFDERNLRNARLILEQAEAFGGSEAEIVQWAQAIVNAPTCSTRPAQIATCRWCGSRIMVGLLDPLPQCDCPDSVAMASVCFLSPVPAVEASLQATNAS